MQELNINIIGVNTLNMEPRFLNVTKTVEYQHIHIRFNSKTCDLEKKLINELQATGCVIDAQPEDNEGV